MTVKRPMRHGAGLTRPRAILLVAQGRNGPDWVRLFKFADDRGYDIASVVSRIEDAVTELAAGNADLLVVLQGHHLHPLIEIVTDLTEGPVRSEHRRPRRLR